MLPCSEGPKVNLSVDELTGSWHMPCCRSCGKCGAGSVWGPIKVECRITRTGGGGCAGGYCRRGRRDPLRGKPATISFYRQHVFLEKVLHGFACGAPGGRGGDAYKHYRGNFHPETARMKGLTVQSQKVKQILPAISKTDDDLKRLSQKSSSSD